MLLPTPQSRSTCAAYYEFDYPLVGKFNVENVMCAFGIGLQLGFPAETIVEALEEAPQIPGRLERVSAS